MMKLKFSVEDILRDDTNNIKTPTSPSSHEGTVIDGKRHMTSDGESVRSESPDSTTSMNSDDVDKKGARRIRTMIQHWQKDLLESAFSNHQYPTVHQYESLSKQLGLPHYVTKVWFQNRRSKSRKEGTREHNRRQSYPYSTKSRPITEPRTAEKTSLREAEEKQRMETMRSPPFLIKQAKPCHCEECVAASINMNAVERNILPQPITMREICNCGECIQRFAANGSLEMRPIQQGNVDCLRFPIQFGSQKPKRPCNCKECMAEVQKLGDRIKLGGTIAHTIHNTGAPEIAYPAQFIQPQASPETTRKRSTLHYLAVPYENNFSKHHAEGGIKQRCSCINCYTNIKGPNY